LPISLYKYRTNEAVTYVNCQTQTALYKELITPETTDNKKNE